MRDANEEEQALAEMLGAAEQGGLALSPQLFSALYRELHRLAQRQLHAGSGNLTLGATTLLHEAYLQLSGRTLSFPDRPRFYAYAARAMRGLIVDYVRERRALKRGGAFHLTSQNTERSRSPASKIWIRCPMRSTSWPSPIRHWPSWWS